MSAEFDCAEIATWWPTGTAPVDPVPDAIVVARDAVAAAGPRHRKEAKTAFRYACELLSWTAEQGLAVDSSAAFAAERVDKYLADTGLLKTNSGNAMSSYLRRLAPGIGFGGSTRRTAAGPPTQPALDPASVTATPGTTPSAEIVEVLTTYVPDRLAADRFEVVAAVVRTGAAAAAPATVSQARGLMRTGAYLAAWVEHEGRPVRPDVVFHPQTIEDFLAQVAGAVPPGTLATWASELHAAREGLGIELGPVERRVIGRRDSNKAPYAPAEVAALYRDAGRVPTASRRRFVTAALDLVFGAGLGPGEAGWATPGWIVERDGRVELDIVSRGWRERADVDGDALAVLGLPSNSGGEQRRRVVVRGDYADRLLEVRDQANAAGDKFLLGGSDNQRSKRFSALVAPAASGAWGVPVDSTRANLTWAVHALGPLCAAVGGPDDLELLLRRPAVLRALRALDAQERQRQ